MEVKTVTVQISTIELNPELANLAYEMGLNVSNTRENALKEAIRRLKAQIWIVLAFATRRSRPFF